ncbi:hypothetical protein AB0395_29695 [Streptosporangium sp. NPDC051023]|uniref:hypothetical protein n=1 Tax=Streptosporangium sp. NPDC051023 TaxID=3155410 RepID=UPI00344DFC9B
MTNTKPDKPTCGAGFVTDDGTQSFACGRDAGRHIVHQDADGTKAVRVPGGAIVIKPSSK